MADNSRIVVSTESLVQAAADVDLQIDRMQKAFDEIGQKVERTSYYWEGSGRDAFYSEYKKKTDKIRLSLARFREQTNDLRVMAGVYQETEKTVQEETEKLASDVII